MKWSNCQPSSVRGAHLAGPRAATKSRIIMTPLQIFAPVRNRDFSSALIATPHRPPRILGLEKWQKFCEGILRSPTKPSFGVPPPRFLGAALRRIVRPLIRSRGQAYEESDRSAHP